MYEYIDSNVSTLHKTINEYKLQVQAQFSLKDQSQEDMETRLSERLSDLKSVVKVIREELDYNVTKLSKHIFET